MTGRKFNKNVLISEVYTRPALWRADDKNFKRRDLTSKLWADVGQICQISAIDAKTKWKSLKDQFRRELQKVPPARSKWQYFEMMQFTKHYISTVSTDGGCVKDEFDFEHDASGEELNADDEEKDYDCEYSDEDEVSCAQSTSSLVGLNSSHEAALIIGPSAKRQKRKREDAEDKSFELEQKKVDLLEKAILQWENSDLQFFRSLMPYMDAFSPLEKLQVRTKIQGIVLEQYAKVQETSMLQEVHLKQERFSFSPSHEFS